MTPNFEEVMLKRRDEELYKIVTGPVDDYQPAAMEAAKKEYAKRNLSDEQIESIKQEIEEERQINEDKANEPLEFTWKLLTFSFPGLIHIIYSVSYRAEGYDRKAKELVTWTLYGFGFYVGFIVLMTLLSAIF